MRLPLPLLADALLGAAEPLVLEVRLCSGIVSGIFWFDTDRLHQSRSAAVHNDADGKVGSILLNRNHA